MKFWDLKKLVKVRNIKKDFQDLPFCMLGSYRILFLFTATLSITGSLSSSVIFVDDSWPIEVLPVNDGLWSCWFLSLNSSSLNFLFDLQ